MAKTSMRILILLIFGVANIAIGEEPPLVDPNAGWDLPPSLLEAREHRYSGGLHQNELFRYRLFVPRALQPGERCPMLVWLHGSGEAGTDNELHLRWMDLILDDRLHIEKYRYFILAVQSPDKGWSDEMLSVVADIARQVVREYPVDADRVCLSGVSSGGSGCWNMVMQYPELFSAVAPMGSGGGRVSQPERLANVPIWSFHNRYDVGTSPTGVEETTAAVRMAGGNACLTLLPRAGHDCWTEAVQKYYVLDWLLGQRRGGEWWRVTRWHWLYYGGWLRMLAVPGAFLFIVWLGCCSERRRQQRILHVAAVSKSERSTQQECRNAGGGVP
jgi:hypothetical protein